MDLASQKLYTPAACREFCTEHVLNEFSYHIMKKKREILTQIALVRMSSGSLDRYLKTTTS